jgi:branched-chain amino acid transport system substrate-binding protein
MKQARRASGWAAVAVLATMVTACGSDNGSSGGTTTEPAATTAASSPTTTGSGVSTTTGGAGTTASSSAQQGPADQSLEPIYIGWISNDTGTPSFPDATIGARAAVKYMNAELRGIDGHRVELVECATSADQESNQKCGQQLANDSRVKVVLSGLLLNGGPAYTALHTAGKSVLGRVPLTGADYNSPNVVFYGSGSPGSNLGVGTFLAGLDGVSSVGVLTQDSEAGRGAYAFVEKQLKAAGKTAKNVVVNEASPDFASALSALGDVDAVYIGLTAPSCLQIGQNAALLPADAVMVGATSCVNSAVWKQVPDQQEGWYFVTGDLPLDAGTGVDSNLDVFLDKFATYSDDPAGRFSNGHWANVLTLRDVLQKVGVDNLTPESIGNALTAFAGPVEMGPSTVTCPGAVYPTVCVSTVRPYQVKAGKAVLVDPKVEIDFTKA